MEPAGMHTDEWLEVGVRWFQIRGDLDVSTADRTFEACPHGSGSAVHALLIDVTAVTFLDCSGIRQLLGMQRLAQRLGYPMVIVTGGNRFVHRLTTLLALDRSLPLYEDFNGGLSALRTTTRAARPSN